MIIRCPQCDFTNEIPSEAIPKTATMATCPKCGIKFRFRELPSEGDGAVIPPREQPTVTPLHLDTAESDDISTDARVEGSDEHLEELLRVLRVKPATRRARVGDEIPWEKPGPHSMFFAFYQTVIRTLMQPVRFFTLAGRCKGPTTRAIVFFVLLGCLQTGLKLFWAHEALSGIVTDPQVRQMLGAVGTNIGLAVVMTPVILLVQLYLFTVLFYLMLRLIRPECVRFGAVLRVLAYSASTGIVCLVPVVGPVVSSVWYAASTFVGIRYATGLSWAKTAVALFPLYVLSMAIQVNMLMKLGAL